MTPEQIKILKELDNQVLLNRKRRKLEQTINEREYNHKEIINEQLDRDQIADIKVYEK